MRERTCGAFCRRKSRSRSLRRWISLALLVAGPLAAHDQITTKLTWSLEISRLVNRHCAGCHRENGKAFGLTSYAEARPWAKAIRDQVLSRQMPPWGLVKGVGAFKDDPSLSFPEIEMLVAWVEGGAPEGDPALLPKMTSTRSHRTPVAFVRTLEVATTLTLPTAATVKGLRPAGLTSHQRMEAWATAPDGTVDRLVAISDAAPGATRDYALRLPIRLPAGTRIRVTAPPVLR